MLDRIIAATALHFGGRLSAGNGKIKTCGSAIKPFGSNKERADASAPNVDSRNPATYEFWRVRDSAEGRCPQCGFENPPVQVLWGVWNGSFRKDKKRKFSPSSPTPNCLHAAPLAERYTAQSSGAGKRAASATGERQDDTALLLTFERLEQR